LRGYWLASCVGSCVVVNPCPAIVEDIEDSDASGDIDALADALARYESENCEDGDR
jgi:hypothetical protein